MKQMDRANIEGVELEYEIRGTGEPVALAHAGVFADWFKPLLEEQTLTGRYRVLSYHRIGYAGSSIKQPVLAVLGAKSTEVSPVFGKRHELLLAWLPKVEAFILPDAWRLLHVQNPRSMAAGLATFFARHPLSTSR